MRNPQHQAMSIENTHQTYCTHAYPRHTLMRLHGYTLKSLHASFFNEKVNTFAIQQHKLSTHAHVSSAIHAM